MSNSLQERAEPAAWLEENESSEGERTKAAPAWGFGKRFLLRFTFTYLVLYMLGFLLEVLPLLGKLELGETYELLWTSFAPWIGKRLFHLDVAVLENGSGDTTYDYMKVLCFFLVALLAGLAWTILDRKGRNDARLYDWLRVYVRFSLASAMILYGASKVFSAQFGPPGYYRLLETFGEASPMGLLWTFMGLSRGYTLFAGLAEMAGGILLISRRTTLLGALVSVGVLLNVVLLNFFYDVPVKLFSSHLLAMAVLLTLPDLRRMADFLLFNRRVEPAEIRPLFRSPRLNRAALVLRTVFIVGLSIYWLHDCYTTDQQYGYLAPKPPFHGAWEVEEYAVNGQPRPPLLTDAARWRRVLFDEPGFLGIHAMDKEKDQYYVLKLDTQAKRFVLSKFKDPKWRSVLSYQQPRPDVLTLAGTIDGQKVTARLRRMDDSKFLLTSRGFHWINERPFNR